MVAVQRAAAGRDHYDKPLSDLVGELSTRSDRFRTLWAAHDVQHHRTGRKGLHHPVVGDLDLTYEAFELPSEPGLTMLVYTAEPDTPTAQALAILASWAATEDVVVLADPGRVAGLDPSYAMPRRRGVRLRDPLPVGGSERILLDTACVRCTPEGDCVVLLTLDFLTAAALPARSGGPHRPGP